MNAEIAKVIQSKLRSLSRQIESSQLLLQILGGRLRKQSIELAAAEKDLALLNAPLTTQADSQQAIA